jgi:hypothetical protein
MHTTLRLTPAEGKSRAAPPAETGNRVVILARVDGGYVLTPAPTPAAMKVWSSCRDARSLCSTFDRVLSHCPLSTRNRYDLIERILVLSLHYEEAVYQGLNRARQDCAAQLDRLVDQARSLRPGASLGLRFCARSTQNQIRERELAYNRASPRT